MRNIAVIGGGYWGKNLIRDFNKLEALHTVCDINEEALEEYREKYPEVKTTNRYEDIIGNEDIKGVCIALPAHMHYEYVKKFLLGGKHVYVEKPFTLNVKNAEELVKLAAEVKKKLMVGHLLQYHPSICVIKDMIKNKDYIGEIKHISTVRQSLGIYRTFENVLWSFGVHDISVILSLCNDKLPNTRVSCTGSSIITEGIHDIVHCNMDYGDKQITLSVSWLSPEKKQTMTIVGTKGILHFDDVKKEIKLNRNHIEWEGSIPKANKNSEIMKTSDDVLTPLTYECLEFTHCIDNDRKPRTDGEEGLRVIKVLTALQESLDNDGIKVKLFTDENSIGVEEGGEMGYYVHPTATVDEGAEVGEGTKIWHYSHVCAGARIGKNCTVGQNVYIGGDAKLGDNCKVQNNVSVYDGVEAGDNVFFGPSCVLTNDINPRCRYSKNGNYMKTILADGVTLGANCTIVCGNSIGCDAMVGAGAVVCKDVAANALVVGNPARRIGSVDATGSRQLFKM